MDSETDPKFSQITLAAFGFLFLGYIHFVMTSLRILFQNSPANVQGVRLRAIESCTTENATHANETINESSQWGLTTGCPVNRVSLIDVDLGLLLTTLAVGFTAIMIVLGLSKVFGIGKIAVPIFAIIYLGGILHLLGQTTALHYITGEKILPPLSGLDRHRYNLHLLLGVQGFLIGLVPYVWSLPVIPDYIAKNRGREDANLRLHLENWRKYGSWIITLFGGLAVTSALAYLGNTPFGIRYIQHALILFSGCLLLILGYIFEKIRYIEKNIAKNDLTPPF